MIKYKLQVFLYGVMDEEVTTINILFENGMGRVEGPGLSVPNYYEILIMKLYQIQRTQVN